MTKVSSRVKWLPPVVETSPLQGASLKTTKITSFLPTSRPYFSALLGEIIGAGNLPATSQFFNGHIDAVRLSILSH